MPKNPKFEYDAKQPAFLQKLRGQYGDNTGRLERPALRPTRLKVNNDDDDDEPTYIDEDSNEVISKEEYKAMVGESGPKEEGEAGDSAMDNSTGDHVKSQTEASISKQNNLTEIGGQRKRKQAKVVGEDKAEAKEVQPKAASKKSKKPKKIKLSFDEE
ncbi:ribosome assembly protein 1 [Penicillium digitatum]|uniref:DUF4604 domain-containing protein n=3 Tax=Penicillium digitatum TaxID=36651 RepID=K9H0I4_PEND2|nr:hypothetical protein PDIP_81810 [Penicillium digitatum Pd1]EKV05741.1 hypothetical protein PDIP_81810 [Penicillium digitatum Pd1]EKV18701.1 hypothetical protein PDIG_07690 [Penicillium digitatum PHI26]KAG0161285.1 hypothetical protein PDIDSM_8819 [Penicillium digitatum]QQK40436.1 ribosome assembly protein 1 [Penicillium digitatum]